MKCKMCTTAEATKKNTHFLTDAIIRTCLNFDGSNEREKGYFFEMSSNNPFVDFGFQRSTSQEELEKGLNRLPNDEEMEKAKQNPYTVDFHFSRDCEGLFGLIESDFLRKILPIIQSATSSPIEIIDTKLIRLFSYLQLWRSSVCEDSFSLPQEIEESLRVKLLKYKIIDDCEINDIPISVTFLETIGKKTHNFVSLLPSKIHK